MAQQASLTKRFIIGKSIGLAIGLVGFVFLPYFYEDVALHFRFGVLFWYSTMGAFIAMFGVLTVHPMFPQFPMPWWFRASILGLWLNGLLLLFCYDIFVPMLAAYPEMQSATFIIFGGLLEGLIIALFIGYFENLYGGEGIEALQNDLKK
ncbi:MAG: hypothetical protein K0U45_03970 [Alphaproteobacteria bacterium]|nr:hypothetical protein [Alphaproteobacteria bacterium]